MRKLNFILFFQLAMYCSLQVSAQRFDPFLSERLQKKLDSLKTAYAITGISASILLPGEDWWKGTTGVSKGTVQIKSDMEFGIASNTKLFTAVTLLKLAEQQILGLDDSLHQWLPQQANIDPNITIRQLLNHTSGLADYNNFAGYPDSILSNPNRIFTPGELIQWVGPPLFAAGTSWDYCNTNYLLAGMIAESATGRKIAPLIRENILNPLQLDSTFFDVQETVTGTIANPWQMGIDIGSIPRNSLNSAAYSAGAMYSTSSEMAQWYQKLMGGALLQPTSFQQMTTFVGSGNYGLGLSKIVVAGRTCFAHGGSIRGYASFMLYDTTTKATICVLMNSNPAPARLVAEQLLLTMASFPLSSGEPSGAKAHVLPYPNPCATLLHVAGARGYEIYNSQGQLILQSAAATTEINVETLPQGLYYLKTGQYFSKFLKE